MKKILSLVMIAVSYCALANPGEVVTGKQANTIVNGAVMVRMYDHTNVPAFVKFAENAELPVSKFEAWLNQYNDSQFPLGLERIDVKKENNGQVHYRYKITLNGFSIENGMYILHTRGGFIQSMNGEVDLNVGKSSKALSFEQAFQKVLQYVAADEYKWNNQEEEEHLKLESGNPSASYYPTENLVWVRKDAKRGNSLELVYKMNIYATTPLYRADVYVSATNGDIIFENKEIKHADENGTAETKYSGTQTIVADNTGSGYRLRETGRGNGINTFNMQEGTNYGNAVDFMDADNYWDNVNANVDEAATDAHWGAEMTYDYFMLEHGRNSIDGSGFTLNSYIHYDQNYSNAFWDGQRMTYGDGGSGTNPFCALDIAGHEITHGLINFTANLVYQDESGALNESFADIFGVSIEWYARPGNANWLMGEDLGFVIRNMQNPKQYGDPNTYQGQFWHTAASDNGGVHTNSGVQNFWYYLLVNGGTGTNDNGEAYTVNGLGLEDASDVAFRNLTVYLTSSSDYYDARFYAIQSAIDLFGTCTPEVESVTNAWFAVGLGQEYVNEVVADFEADLAEGCAAPFTTSFKNLSFNATSFSWDLGNGDTPTAVNPTTTYNTQGDFTVSLIADGGACGKDTIEIVDYISVNPANECLVIMNGITNNSTQVGCFGRLVDDGGMDGDYSPNMTTTVTVEPSGADQVILYFDFFDVESGDDGTCNYDVLEVYSGTSATPGNLIGSYCNTSLPPTQLIVSSSAATVRFVTDQGLQQGGFEIRWACSQSNTAPVVDFAANTVLSCQPDISFTDYSLNAPTSWQWDFGDGTSSTDQNPIHHYSNSGVYEVKLVATNAFGIDSLIRTNYIDVDLPDEPTGLSKDLLDTCFNAPVTLSGTATDEIRWYENYGDATPVGTGSPFTTPVIPASTVYYAENFVEGQSQGVGMSTNAGGGNNFNNPDQYLIFSVYKPMVLQTVKVYAEGAENRTIELRDANGAVVDSRTVFIEDGEQIVTLDFSIMPGSEYQLGLIPVIQPNLYRNNGGVQYPYSIPGLMTIERSSADNNPTSYYYWFYDWQVKPADCKSELVPINLDLVNCFLSAEEQENISISVYPNPTNSVFFVEGFSDASYTWTLVDVSGKVVKQGNYDALVNGIDVSNFRPGMYVLRLTNGSNQFNLNILRD